MNRWEKAERWILYSTATLVCLVLVSFWMTCNMYARYTSEASGSDSARVAVFAHDETIDATGTIKKMYPGDAVSYTLDVTNFKGEKRSEVSLQYSIEVKTAGNLPLQYTLTKDNITVGTFNEKSDEKEYTFETDSMKFGIDAKEQHTYKLNITWPATENSASLAEIPDYLDITVHVEQID